MAPALREVRIDHRLDAPGFNCVHRSAGPMLLTRPMPGIRRGARVVVNWLLRGRCAGLGLAPSHGEEIPPVGARTGGPILLSSHGTRMDSHADTRRLRRLRRTAGIRITTTHPHMLRRAFFTPCSKSAEGMLVSPTFIGLCSEPSSIATWPAWPEGSRPAVCGVRAHGCGTRSVPPGHMIKEILNCRDHLAENRSGSR